MKIVAKIINTTLNLGSDYTQLCCWPATLVGNSRINEFEKFMLDKFGVRIKYATETKTKPDSTGPGGRNDVLFYIHNDDIFLFAVQRLEYGIRWWEDIYQNDNSKLYEDKILELYQPRW